MLKRTLKLYPSNFLSTNIKSTTTNHYNPIFTAYTPQLPLNLQRHNLTFRNIQIAKMSTKSTTAPGEQFEIRQTSSTEDWKPNPAKSLPLDKARQELVDDILELYSCRPTVERVKRYTPDCVYDDQFVYANDRYKMAGQWFALPKLFKASKNEGYEVVRSDDEVIQFKNEQSWTFKLIPKTATINALVTLSLDPETVHSDFIRVKYHKDQANDKDYSHEGVGFSFKKWQADNVVKWMDSPEVEVFKVDKGAAKESVRKYGDGKGEAPVKDL